MRKEMDKNKLSMQENIFYFSLIATLFSLFPQEAFAAPITITEMFANLQDTWKSLYRLARLFSYIVGIALFVIGLHKMVLVSKEKAELKTVITYVLAGTLLVMIPGFIDAVNSQMGLEELQFGLNEGMNTKQNSLFDSTSVGSKVTGDTKRAFYSIIGLIQVVGFIAVIRGLLIFKALGDQRNQASLSKAILHIIPGAMLINCIEVASIFSNTVGLSDRFGAAGRLFGG